MKNKYILPLLIFSSTLLVGCGSKASLSRDSEEIKEDKHQSRLLEVNENTPSIDQSDVKDVIARVLYKVANRSDYKVTSEGTSKASIATQSISNLRIVKDNKAFLQTTSTGLINFSKQRFLLKDEEKYFQREASSVSSSNVTYDDSSLPECYSFSYYLDEYGALPFQATSYVINEDTYLSTPTISKEGDNYKINISLDPSSDKAPYYYVSEILTSSESSTVPVFTLINLEWVIDENYNLITATQDEEYDVTKIIKAHTVTHVVDTYSYENIEFDENIYSYFSKYFSNEVII